MLVVSVQALIHSPIHVNIQELKDESILIRTFSDTKADGSKEHCEVAPSPLPSQQLQLQGCLHMLTHADQVLW